MAEEKVLKAATVIAYAERHLQIKQLEKDEREDRERIIKLMKKGYLCPEGLAYVLILTNQERHPVSWKDEWTVLARRFLKKTSLVRLEMEQIMDSAEVVNTPMLLVEPAIQKKSKVVTMKGAA